MKKNIVVIAGGYSKEFFISLKSGANVYDQIKSEQYNKYLMIIEKDKWFVKKDECEYLVDKNDFSIEYKGEKIKFDFAYITVHGIPGENGMLQGYLDMAGIRYSTSGVLVEALTFDKYSCNNYLKTFGINVSPSTLLRKNRSYEKENIIKEIGLPCFIKPNSDGSSFGVSKVSSIDDFDEAVEKIHSGGDHAIVESFIAGQEFTCGICKIGNKTLLMPIAEIISQNDFFDYEAKYDSDLTEEIIPARFSEEITDEIHEMVKNIYEILDCRGIIRVDGFIRNNEIIMLEVNTTPGMTNASFIPKMLAYMNISLGDLITQMIEN